MRALASAADPAAGSCVTRHFGFSISPTRKMSATQSRRAARNCAALRGGKDIQTGTGPSGIVGGNDAAEETSRIFAKLGVDKSVGNLIPGLSRRNPPQLCFAVTIPAVAGSQSRSLHKVRRPLRRQL